MVVARGRLPVLEGLRERGAPGVELLRRRGGPALEAAVAAAAVVVAGLPWHRAYHVSGFWPAFVAAAIVPVALAFVLSGRIRLRISFSCGVSLLGFVAVVLALLGPHPAAVWRGLSRGPSHLLTDTLPLAGPRWVLVVPVALTWLSAAAVGELLSRRRNPGPALGVVVASFVLSVAGSSAAPGSSLGVGVILVVLLAISALVRLSPWRAGASGVGVIRGDGPSSGDGRPPMGRAAAGVVAAGAVALGLWFIVPSLPGLGSSTSAVTRQPPVTPALATSPLDTIALLRDANPDGPATPLISITTSEPSTGYLALAAFDSYDGGGWSFNRTYIPTGGRIPQPPAGEPAAVGPIIRQHYVIIESLPATLPFVPFVDHPLTVSGLSVDADATSGTVVPLSAAVVGDRYDVVSRAPEVTLGGLAATAQLGTAGGSAGIALPAAVSADLGPALTYLASLTHETPTPTVAFLQALVSSLQREDKRLIPGQTQSGGTSLAEVVSAVTASHAATPEQFATFFAAVARSLGVPARVVTGFRITPATGELVPAGQTTVTNRQAWTWVEIPVVGMGWVVVDPTPTATTEVATPPAAATESNAPTTTTPAQNALPTSGEPAHALAPAVNVHHRPGRGLSPWWVALLAIGGLALAVVALFALVGLARAWRRARRRRGPAASQAAGAWLDVLDALARAGVDPGSATTTREVADVAGRSFGPDLVDPLRRVGTTAERALFSTGAVPDAPATQESWATATEFGRNLRGRLSRSQRVAGALRVGVSRRHRVRRSRRHRVVPSRRRRIVGRGAGPAPREMSSGAPLVESGTPSDTKLIE